jgi:glycogen operon protein
MNSHSIAFTLHNIAVSQVRYIAINAYWRPLDFELPPVTDKPEAAWLRLVDTSLPSPQDVTEEGMVVPVNGSNYTVNPRSIVMLHYNDVHVDQGAKVR